MSKLKVETLEEFIARGGNVTKVPYKEPEVQKAVISTSYSTTPLELDEGALYYAEPNKNSKSKSSKVKSDSKPKADPEKLPEHLRKYL